MSDLIDRQATMKEFATFVRASNNSDFEHTPTWNDAVSLVGSMPSVQQWIPVVERLPEEDHNVLITDEDGEVLIAHYTDWSKLGDFGLEWWANDFRVFPVAWRELPEPWEGDAE